MEKYLVCELTRGDLSYHLTNDKKAPSRILKSQRLLVDRDVDFFDWIVDEDSHAVRAIEIHIPFNDFAIEYPLLACQDFVTNHWGFPAVWLAPIHQGICLNAEDWDIELRHNSDKTAIVLVAGTRCISKYVV